MEAPSRCPGWQRLCPRCPDRGHQKACVPRAQLSCLAGHSQNHFTTGTKDQKFYGHFGNYSSPTHLPFHLHTHCPRIANSSLLLSCFSKDFTAGKQRLEIFQKLGHSCLQEPFWKASHGKSPSSFKAPATGFAQLRELDCDPHPEVFPPIRVCPRDVQAPLLNCRSHMQEQKLLDRHDQAHL